MLKSLDRILKLYIYFLCGFPTAPSSSHDDPRCHKWMLNEPAENSSWCAKVADLNQYFEIGATNTLPIQWVKITTKGRENLNQLVGFIIYSSYC